jgi:hypothetical protein
MSATWAGQSGRCRATHVRKGHLTTAGSLIIAVAVGVAIGVAGRLLAGRSRLVPVWLRGGAPVRAPSPVRVSRFRHAGAQGRGTNSTWRGHAEQTPMTAADGVPACGLFLLMTGGSTTHGPPGKSGDQNRQQEHTGEGEQQQRDVRGPAATRRQEARPHGLVGWSTASTSARERRGLICRYSGSATIRANACRDG